MTRLFWLIPLALAIVGWRVFARSRQRNDRLTTEPVSSEWLAQARAREEERW
jgi:hypothetical protein